MASKNFPSSFREITKKNKDHKTEKIDILNIYKYEDYVQSTPIIKSCTLKLYLPRKLYI